MPYAIRDHHYHTLLQALSSLLFSGLGPSCPNKDGTDKHSKALQPMMKVSGQSPAYCFTFHNTVTPSSAAAAALSGGNAEWARHSQQATAAMHWLEKKHTLISKTVLFFCVFCFSNIFPSYAILSLHFTWFIFFLSIPWIRSLDSLFNSLKFLSQTKPLVCPQPIMHHSSEQLMSWKRISMLVYENRRYF